MGSGAGLFNLYRDSEVIVTRELDRLPLDEISLPSLQINPGTDLAACFIELIVSPMDGTVAVGDYSWFRRNEACSIVGVDRVKKKLTPIFTGGIEAVFPSIWGLKPAA